MSFHVPYHRCCADNLKRIWYVHVESFMFTYVVDMWEGSALITAISSDNGQWMQFQWWLSLQLIYSRTLECTRANIVRVFDDVISSQSHTIVPTRRRPPSICRGSVNRRLTLLFIVARFIQRVNDTKMSNPNLNIMPASKHNEIGVLNPHITWPSCCWSTPYLFRLHERSWNRTSKWSQYTSKQADYIHMLTCIRTFKR